MTTLEEGRRSYAEHRWRDAYSTLSSADAEAPLDLDDLERLAISTYMVGEDAASADAWTRAHQRALERGDAPRAAKCAFWHSSGLLFRGDMAPAMGWIARGKRVLDESGVDCAEQAWSLVLTNLPLLFQGDASTYPRFVEAAETAARFDDRNAVSMSRLAQGQAEMMSGRMKEGLALLDEVMVSVTSGEMAPIFAGIAYCAVIDACQRIFDLRRAREWTAALSRWCDAQQDLVPYRGNCLIHRCEIFQMQGDWVEAMDAAERACDRLKGPPPWDSLGAAAYQLGEIQRLRGDLAAAEGSYRRASASGREPEPGMSLVRLARDRADLATASVGRALDEARDPPSRSKLLPAAVEILLATGDPQGARACADELAEIAAFLDAPVLQAFADHAAGAVLLAEGDARGALNKLREACAAWRRLDVPHEAARARELIGVACREVGDVATAELELDAARSAFESLEAAPDLTRLDALHAPAPQAGSRGGLTARELQVLRLVAAGNTNRAIASELVLSEKTVARHVANIFTKLGVSSRSAATAYAYENDLV